MLLTDSRTARVLVTVLLFALGLGFLYVTRETLIAFLFAIFFAYLMSPLVNNLEKVLKGRVRAIAVIYALLLALVIVFFVIVGPKVTRDAGSLGHALPGLLEKLSSGEFTSKLERERGWSHNTVVAVQSFLVSHQDDITDMQILLARFQMQEGVVTRASDHLNDARQKVLDIHTRQKDLSGEVERLEDAVNAAQNPQQQTDLQDRIKRVRSSLEVTGNIAQQQQTAEIQAEQRLREEQDKLGALESQMDELIRAMGSLAEKSSVGHP